MPTKAKPEETKRSEEEVVAGIQKQMQVAGKYYEEHFVGRADRMVNLYEVNHYFDETTGKKTKAAHDRIKVPYPYANTRQILAEIFTGLPEAVVKCEKKEDVDEETGQPVDPVKGAEMLRKGIEYVKRRSNMEREVKMNALDGVVTGLGCVGISAQARTKIPKYTRHLYRDIIADWSNVTNVYDSDWIACKLVRPLDEIKKDERYNENRDKVRAAKIEKDKLGDTNLSPDYGVLWCYHNKRTNQYLVFPDDQSFLLEEKRLSDVYDFKVVSDDFVVDWPFAFFIDEESIQFAWGIGDVFPIESQVRELDKTRTQQINHRKRFNRKYLVRKGFLTTQGVNQFKNPEDGTMVEAEKEITPANFQVVQDAPMSADVYQVDQIIQNDIQIVSPLGPNALVRGVGERPDTLGEAQMIEQSANTRLADKQKQLAAQIARLYKLTGQFIQQYWKDEDWLLVTGDGSKEGDWIKFSPQDIKGEYDYDVVPESMKDNSAVYRKQAADAMALVIPVLDRASTDPATAVMVRKYLETFDTFKKDLDTIIPQEWMEPKAVVQDSAPMEVPSISMKASDFPVPVQIKMLKLAGIDATEEDFMMPGPGTSGENDGMDGALQDLAEENPQAFLDSLNSLSEDEREAIIERMQGGGSSSQSVQGMPSPSMGESVPTESSITTAATSVKV